jgi:hypothetical protein
MQKTDVKEGKYHLHPQGRKSAEQETSVYPEVILSSETSIPIRTTRRYIPEDENTTTAVGISHPTE